MICNIAVVTGTKVFLLNDAFYFVKGKELSNFGVCVCTVQWVEQIFWGIKELPRKMWVRIDWREAQGRCRVGAGGTETFAGWYFGLEAVCLFVLFFPGGPWHPRGRAEKGDDSQLGFVRPCGGRRGLALEWWWKNRTVSLAAGRLIYGRRWLECSGKVLKGPSLKSGQWAEEL